jgi:hypothetical protein
MNFKGLGIAVLTGLALMSFASSASATTVEVGGVKQTGVVSLEWSIETVAVWEDTPRYFANSCTASTVAVSDSTRQTGTAVEGPLSTLSWGTTATPCTEGNPTVDAKGSLSFEWISGTTNGTVKSKNAKVTVPSALGSLTCTTPAEGTDLGTVTGVASGQAKVDVSAAFACGITLRLTARYVITSPWDTSFMV